MKILILYSSIDGHTKNICSFISNKLKQNHIIEMSEIDKDEKIKFYFYDFIIVSLRNVSLIIVSLKNE